MNHVLPRICATVLAILPLVGAPAAAGTVEGLLFDDRNGNGLVDPGEPGLSDVAVTAWWGPAARFAATTSGDGTFTLDADSGPHQVEVLLPDGWRFSLPDQTWDPVVSGPNDDVVQPRWGSAQALRRNVDAADSLLLISLGDSIPDGFNLCGVDSDYLPEVTVDLEDITGEPVVLSNDALAGAHSEDLLTPRLAGGGDNEQFIPRVLAREPGVVTINIGGNDFLSSDDDVPTSLQELAATRASLQEAISVLLTELPDADVVLNTVYDPYAEDCDTSAFNAAVVPVWNQVVRWSAVSQVRPVSLAEVNLDFAHQDVTRTRCAGAEARICTFFLDRIHPNAEGADIIRRAMLEALGEVRVPAAGTIGPVTIGLQRRVAVLAPTTARVVSGAVTAPEAALVRNDVPAVLSPDATAVTELRVSGFELPPGLEPEALIVGVRYRTSAAFDDDEHRFEASFADFTPPASLDVATWDWITPIVGGSGTSGSGNVEGRSRVNLLPDVPAWREVTARATLNLVDDGSVSGFPAWPAPTAEDLARLEVRLRLQTVGAPDGATVEWDAAWVEVLGAGQAVGPELGEVSDVRAGEPPLRVNRATTELSLAWDPEPEAGGYRVYRNALPARTGSPLAFATAPAAACSAASEASLAPEAGSAWFLVAALAELAPGSAEGPLGPDSLGSPRSAGGADCP